MAHAKVHLTAGDDVPLEVCRTVSQKVETLVRRADPGKDAEVTVSRRDNPDEIYDVGVSVHGKEFRQDFQPGDLDSERFDIWLAQGGKHLAEPCWCGHSSTDHALPECTRCEEVEHV